ncbi:MAG: hypothetical protein MUO27_05720 [Sedimentisphaerales bacterium]|nr:hypothetical protein [Sedimentisphaerales bacterium]
MKVIFKKVLGIFLIIVGLLALLTPLTPGSWLALIGLELLGVRMLVEKKFLKEKHRVAIAGFMKKFGFESSGNKAGKKEG